MAAARRVDVAFVNIWGRTAGAVAWDDQRGHATFEYDPVFLDSNLDLSPLHMPLAAARRGSVRFAFPALPRAAFMGLPGLLADALPDRFGHRLIDAWLAAQGRGRDDFSPVERLCYVGNRGMGALTFAPALRGTPAHDARVDIAELVTLAREVLHERAQLETSIRERTKAIADILRVGTSAGGARAKAVIALNDETGEVRSGQLEAPPGFAHWLLKFDGVEDQALNDPKGYGRLEYAYYLMATEAGITMSTCRILEEGGRAHFMTRRFDRTPEGDRLHLQTLCALAHLDFNDPLAHTYEQAFAVARELRVPYPDLAELYRRMVFNAAARNQDDHTKNMAFLMHPTGEWRLAPAYDMIWAYNPDGRWTHRHQMSMNGKRDGMTRADLLAVAANVGVKKPEAIITQVTASLAAWERHAAMAGVADRQAARVGATFRAF
jgi:serine/threonine-protein kinase HipA